MKNAYLLTVFLCLAATAFSQNLLVNPSAETGDPTSTGWTNVSMGSTGASCYNNSGWRIAGNQNGFPVAEQGTYFFYAGCSTSTGSTFEVRQDVSVSANASLIDKGWDSFTFSGYMQSYAQSPPDQAEMIVEYRDVTNTIVLTSYNTGLTSNQGTWTFYSNTTKAPAGTRVIRVRLLAKLNTGPSIDAYFDNLLLTTSIPLAVVLSSFDVEPVNNQVKLGWATSSENDNGYFTVQRSANLSDWTEVDRVAGGNDTSASVNYVAYDNNPLEGVSYYRLQITAGDGSESYSETKEIDFTPVFADLTIFPNPAKTFFMLAGNNVKNLRIALYNNVGQLINVSLAVQNSTMTVNTAGLPRGIYFLRLTNTLITEVRKILIE